MNLLLPQIMLMGGVTLIKEDKFDVIQFLASHKKKIIYELQSKDNISISNKEKTIKYFLILFNFLISAAQQNESDGIEKLNTLSLKATTSEIKAGTDIKGFLHTLSILKAQIFLHLNKQNESPILIKDAQLRINDCFDLFINTSIPKFIELSNEVNLRENSQITEKHRERLTLLGQMTSSFVHEFRNPLTSIKGFIQLLRAEYPELKYLNIISSELEQLNSRISQFLLISRKEQVETNSILFQLNLLIEEVITFLYPSIVDSNVKVESFVEEDIYIRGNPEEIRQVLLNIIFNALDVLSQTNEPLITIASNKVKSNMVQLTIANNGPKISEELLKNIFQPFTTTKKVGTGLGLFVCKEIIEKHKGTLSCTSSNKWTHFKILLPQNNQLP